MAPPRVRHSLGTGVGGVVCLYATPVIGSPGDTVRVAGVPRLVVLVPTSPSRFPMSPGGQWVAVGFSFGDLVDDITSPISDAASWLAGAGLTAVDALGDAVQFTASGIAGFSSDVWSVAKSAAGFVGSLPGIHEAIQTVEAATHIIRVILDSPITAIIVVALAAALNTVGLGSGLVAEYAALRVGMDMLDKLERGDTFTIADVAQAVVVAAGSATGLPVGAVSSAVQTATSVGIKVASGQSVSVGDVANLVVAAGTIGAGVSGSSGAAAAVQGVSAANTVARAAGLTGGQTLAKMPVTVDRTNVAHLPDPVVRHVASKIPSVAADAIARSPAGQAAVTAAAQRTQAELVAAERFGTTVSKDYADLTTPLYSMKRPGVSMAAQPITLKPSIVLATTIQTIAKPVSYAAFMTMPNGQRPIGLPEAPPPYHLPLGYGPMYVARDIG